MLIPTMHWLLKRFVWPDVFLLPFLNLMSRVLAVFSFTLLTIFFTSMPTSEITANDHVWAIARYRDPVSLEAAEAALALFRLAPLLASLFTGILAAIYLYISRSSDAGGRSNGSQLLTLSLMSSLLLSWLGPQISIGAYSTATTLQTTGGALLVAGCLLPCLLFGWDETVRHPRVVDWLAGQSGDWLRASLFFFGGAMYIGFLPLALANQVVRTRMWLLASPSGFTDGEWAAWFTPRVSLQLRELRSWNWTSVGQKSMFLSLFTLCIVVGLQNLITLLMGFMVSVLADTPAWATVLAFVATDVTLLVFSPWLAAVPLYYAVGVAVTAALQPGLGFWGAVIAASVISSAIKLLSVTVLHQWLGIRWMRNAALRKAMGLRTLQMRALEMIIQRPGADPAKLTLLVAGPDWGVPIISAMLGMPLRALLAQQTLPIAMLISGPATIAGALQLRLREPQPLPLWGSLSGGLLIFSAALQGVGIIVFNFSVSRTAAQHEAYLLDKPNDREVEELDEMFDRTEAPLLRALETRVSWHGTELPAWATASLILGAASMCLACLGLHFAPASCLADLQIHDSITCPSAEMLANPRRLRLRNCFHSDINLLILPYGWVVLGLFVLGFASKKVFERWMESVKIQLKESGNFDSPSPESEPNNQFIASTSFKRQRMTARGLDRLVNPIHREEVEISNAPPEDIAMFEDERSIDV